jgi:hypothetical protein
MRGYFRETASSAAKQLKERAACGDIVVNRWLSVAAELWTLSRYAIYADLCKVVKALYIGL